MFVLGEADGLLKKGFKDQIYNVYCYLLPVVLLSATIPHDVPEMTTKFMTDPIRILIQRDKLTLKIMKQFFFEAEFGQYPVLYVDFSLPFLDRYCAMAGRSLERKPGGQWVITDSRTMIIRTRRGGSAALRKRRITIRISPTEFKSSSMWSLLD
ncbi:hypothetical protein PILCRDRAFT_266421 [Piloderma croceum F 1598]|uniref:Helicase ATP-binding domain-containing protein n=1 Tax=Piloderma croceum (strain F 1598) TaxID=765440 RepID=A0A0C3BN68_PILCF|nr:hypothetical protein PILCRDRAFT_266421 [Piloderma croceum F 1598]